MSNARMKRLMREAKLAHKGGPASGVLKVDTSDLHTWAFLMSGPENTVFEKGEYWGCVSFCSDYPIKPPSIRFFTPNGVFQANSEICLRGATGQHKEDWDPTMTVLALLSSIRHAMMDPPSGGIGIITETAGRRKQLAEQSPKWNVSQASFPASFRTENNGNEIDSSAATVEGNPSSGDDLTPEEPKMKDVQANVSSDDSENSLVSAMMPEVLKKGLVETAISINKSKLTGRSENWIMEHCVISYTAQMMQAEAEWVKGNQSRKCALRPEELFQALTEITFVCSGRVRKLLHDTSVISMAVDVLELNRNLQKGDYRMGLWFMENLLRSEMLTLDQLSRLQIVATRATSKFSGVDHGRIFLETSLARNSRSGITSRMSDKWKQLAKEVAHGNIDEIEKKLSENAFLVHEVRSWDGFTATIFAASICETDSLIALVERGGNWKYHGPEPKMLRLHQDVLVKAIPLLELLALAAETDGAWTESQLKVRENRIIEIRHLMRVPTYEIQPVDIPVPKPPARGYKPVISLLESLKAINKGEESNYTSEEICRFLIDLVLDCTPRQSQLASFGSQILLDVIRKAFESFYDVDSLENDDENDAYGMRLRLLWYVSKLLLSAAVSYKASDDAELHKDTIAAAIIDGSCLALRIVQSDSFRESYVEGGGNFNVAVAKHTCQECFADVMLSASSALTELSLNLALSSEHLQRNNPSALALDVVRRRATHESCNMGLWLLENLEKGGLLIVQDEKDFTKVISEARATFPEMPRGQNLAISKEKESILSLPSPPAEYNLILHACRTGNTYALASLLLAEDKARRMASLTCINRLDGAGKTPLGYCATAGNAWMADCIIMLVEHGAALRFHSGVNVILGRHHHEIIEKNKEMYLELSRLGRKTRPISPADFAKRNNLVDKIREEFGPPPASQTLCKSLDDCNEKIVEGTDLGDCFRCVEPLIPTNQSQCQKLVRLQPCGHIHHQECVIEWLVKNRAVCPICKKAIKNAYPPRPEPPREVVDRLSSAFALMDKASQNETNPLYELKELSDLVMSDPSLARVVTSSKYLQILHTCVAKHTTTPSVIHHVGFVLLEICIHCKADSNSTWMRMAVECVMVALNAASDTNRNSSVWLLSDEIHCRVLTELTLGPNALRAVKLTVEMDAPKLVEHVLQRALQARNSRNFKAVDALNKTASWYLRNTENERDLRKNQKVTLPTNMPTEQNGSRLDTDHEENVNMQKSKECDWLTTGLIFGLAASLLWRSPKLALFTTACGAFVFFTSKECRVMIDNPDNQKCL
eukprot:m.22255 g.22255  ORF g.22255 m.22255 type:complete len:1282 (+) comp7381_c0_seq1:284-4129(+)